MTQHFMQLIDNFSPPQKQLIATMEGRRILPDKTIFKYDAKFIKYD